MSELYAPPKLFLKRIEMKFRKHGPDHYIFESKGMAETAYKGRGIPKSRTHILSLGVDTKQYSPAKKPDYYAHQIFNIPHERKLFFFSGHMEPRKGISVIMEAAKYLTSNREQKDWHILLFGNKGEEAKPYLKQLANSTASEHVTFGGYRNDIPAIHKSCYAGIIASTGWDSFTCSSLEIQSSGLPLLLSDLPGLKEAIIDQNTGFHFNNGDHKDLAKKIILILDNPSLQSELSKKSRERILSLFSLEIQIKGLANLIKTLSS